MKPSHQPPALLTAFRTLTALCAIADMQFTDAVLVSFAVTSRARTYTSLKTPSAQNLTTEETIKQLMHISIFPLREYNPVFKMVLLSGFQCDDYEDRASVHSTNTAGVTHKIVQDGCELCAHLLIGNSCVIHCSLLFISLEQLC